VDWINPAWDRVIVEGFCERAGSINESKLLSPADTISGSQNELFIKLIILKQ
jgi:hypothetical protein